MCDWIILNEYLRNIDNQPKVNVFVTEMHVSVIVSVRWSLGMDK